MKAGETICGHGVPSYECRQCYPAPTSVPYKQWQDCKSVGTYYRILAEAVRLFADRPFREPEFTDRYYRAAFARFVSAKTRDRDYLKPILFCLFDKGDVNEIIQKMLEPAGNDMRFSTSGIDATEGE